MDGLIELVAASFARHGVECPAGDSMLVWGRTPSRACRRSPERSRGGSRRIQAAPAFTTALPEHNYRKSLQGDPAP